MWLVSGTTVIGSGPPGTRSTDWTIAGIGDFDGDGKADILWRNTNGALEMWFMNGLAVISTASLGNVPSVWSVVGNGDFNGDGKADILWRDTAGNIVMWLMNGASVSSMGPLGNVSTVWSVVGNGDFDGDGKADILWRNTTCASDTVVIWLMNGTSLISNNFLGSASTTWKVPYLANTTATVPGQFIAKMYTEVLGRMPDVGGWNGYINALTQGGCTQSNLQLNGQTFYLGPSPEYANLNYSPAAKVLTAYRGILNQEPDATGFTSCYNYLVGHGDFAAMIDSLFASAAFTNLVPSICGSSATYFFGSNPVIAIPTDAEGPCSGFQGTGAQLQDKLNMTPSGSTVFLACRAVVPITSTLIIPTGVTLATAGYQSTNRYAEMARLVRSSISNRPVVQVSPDANSGAQLLNVWVEGQRGYLGPDTTVSPYRPSVNVLARGSGTVVQNNRISDPTGWTNLLAQGAAADPPEPCGGITVSGNLVTGYATTHPLLPSDGLSLECENTTAQNNQIVDVTDAGIVLFRSTPAVQRSQVSSNQILNAGNSAYWGVTADHATVTGADFTGSSVNNNTIWTGPNAHIDMVLAAGIRELAAFQGWGTGASMTNNGSGSYPGVRTNTGIGVDGMFNANVTGNPFNFLLVATGIDCPTTYVAVTAQWASGTIQMPYINAPLDGCMTSTHPNN